MQERLFCWKIICIFKENEKKLFITNIYVMNLIDTGSFTLNIFFVPMQYRKARKKLNISFSFLIKAYSIVLNELIIVNSSLVLQ